MGKDTSGPAFPGVQEYRAQNQLSGQVVIEKALMPGMTLRDYFAAKAIQGIYACSGSWPNENDAPYAATLAYATADAMLAEASK